VNDIAKFENMPQGLKIQSKTNNVLYDHAWIAGVDYHEKHEHKKSDDEASEGKSDNEGNESIEDDVYDEMEPDKIQSLANNLLHFNTHDNTMTNQTMIDTTDRNISESDDESIAKGTMILLSINQKRCMPINQKRCMPINQE
jgi:hypothetical protein